MSWKTEGTGETKQEVPAKMLYALGDNRLMEKGVYEKSAFGNL